MFVLQENLHDCVGPFLRKRINGLSFLVRSTVLFSLEAMYGTTVGIYLLEKSKSLVSMSRDPKLMIKWFCYTDI